MGVSRSTATKNLVIASGAPSPLAEKAVNQLQNNGIPFFKIDEAISFSSAAPAGKVYSDFEAWDYATETMVQTPKPAERPYGMLELDAAFRTLREVCRQLRLHLSANTKPA